MRRERLAPACATTLQPSQHRGFVSLLLRLRPDALEAFQLPIVVLGGVIEAGHGASVFHLDVGILLAGLFDQSDHVFVMSAHHRIGPAGGVVEFGGQRVTIGTARVTGHHHEVACAQRLVGELQIVLGLVRHVVLGIGGRLAVLAHVGAVERKITGVARPHPVVDIATELAHAAWRRIGQTYVLDLQILEQPVGISAGKAEELTAVTGLRLAGGDLLLAEILQGQCALERIIAGRRHRGLGRRGHVGDGIEHVDARGGACAQFVCRCGGAETVLDQILLRCGIELDRAISTMVIGHHQALRRHQAGSAATQCDHRAHRIAGQVDQLLRRQAQAGLLQRAGDVGQLLRNPHPLACLCGCRERECCQHGNGKQVRTHRTAPER